MSELVFDAIAEAYDRARPGYPDELVDDLLEIAAITASSRILEIGAGTGQATRALAQRGLSVLCLEPGPRLAALARVNLASCPRVRVIEVSFESWPLDRASFDLVVAAQSFHWIEAEIGFAKAHAALRPGGVFAIFANVPVRGQSELDRDIDRCYQQLAPSHQSTGARKRGLLEAQLARCGLFQILPTRQYRWAKLYSADEYVELLRTHSDHHRLPAHERMALLEGVRRAIASHGGSLNLHYESKLLMGRRVV